MKKLFLLLFIAFFSYISTSHAQKVTQRDLKKENSSLDNISINSYSDVNTSKVQKQEKKAVKQKKIKSHSSNHRKKYGNLSIITIDSPGVSALENSFSGLKRNDIRI